MVSKIKEWLDYLFYEVGKQGYDFYLQYSEKEGIKTKWRRYKDVCFDFECPKNRWFLERCNQRQILPCEVVLDLEDKDQLEPTIEKLERFGYTYYVFSTGSRGYHVHIFFNRELVCEEKLKIIKFFGADTQKASNKTLIALEFSKHWKSGKIKKLNQIPPIKND